MFYPRDFWRKLFHNQGFMILIVKVIPHLTQVFNLQKSLELHIRAKICKISIFLPPVNMVY